MKYILVVWVFAGNTPAVTKMEFATVKACVEAQVNIKAQRWPHIYYRPVLVCIRKYGTME